MLRTRRVRPRGAHHVPSIVLGARGNRLPMRVTQAPSPAIMSSLGMNDTHCSYVWTFGPSKIRKDPESGPESSRLVWHRHRNTPSLAPLPHQLQVAQSLQCRHHPSASSAPVCNVALSLRVQYCPLTVSSPARDWTHRHRIQAAASMLPAMPLPSPSEQ